MQTPLLSALKTSSMPLGVWCVWCWCQQQFFFFKIELRSWPRSLLPLPGPRRWQSSWCPCAWVRVLVQRRKWTLQLQEWRGSVECSTRLSRITNVVSEGPYQLSQLSLQFLLKDLITWFGRYLTWQKHQLLGSWSRLSSVLLGATTQSLNSKHVRASCVIQMVMDQKL